MKLVALHITLLLSALTCLGQKPMVLLDVSPKDGEVGEILTITIKSNVQGELDIEMPSGFVHGYNVLNGMEQEMDYNTGKLVTYYYMSQTGAMNKEGSFTFGPAYIKKGNKVYRSNKVTVNIKKERQENHTGTNITAKQLRQPAFGVIETSKSSIYEGEPLIVNAKIYSRFRPTELENYESYSLNGVVDKHDIGNSQRIFYEEIKIKGITLNTFTHDKKVVFPTGTGKTDIEPFKLILRRNFESIPLTSAETTFEIKPLPGNAPKDFTGGVGTYSISRKLGQANLKQGDVFTLVVEVTGIGNLHNIHEPKLNLPKGFILYGDPIVKEDFVFGARGAEGKITYEFNVQVTKFGELYLTGTSMSYFDPTKERYVTIRTGDDKIEVEKNDKFNLTVSAENESEENQAKEEIISLRPNENTKAPKSMYGTKAFWIAFGSPLCLAFLFGIWFKQKKEKQEIEGVAKKAKSSQKEIEVIFDQATISAKSGDHSNGYRLVEKGLQQAISSFLLSEHLVLTNRNELTQQLSSRNIASENINVLFQLLDRCEYVRFGFGETADSSTTIDQAKNWVSQNLRG